MKVVLTWSNLTKVKSPLIICSGGLDYFLTCNQLERYAGQSRIVGILKDTP